MLFRSPFKVEVDLMQPIDPDKKPAVHATPLNHIGLWIDDLPKAVEWLTGQGVRFAPGGIRKGAAGFDLVAAAEQFRPELTGPIFEYDTGLAFEIPEGHVGLVFPRSSVTTKTTLLLGNGVGVIDSDYRGTIKFQYRNMPGSAGKKFSVGDRIGQIIILPIPAVKFEEASELSDTARGEGGFGSTGK